ncbi:hypothetical protein TNCV_3546891 [Trichonephila clavipes]|nr:hypothetical protein TNCV_3546891 [Trichonephila clavipes]
MQISKEAGKQKKGRRDLYTYQNTSNETKEINKTERTPYISNNDNDDQFKRLPYDTNQKHGRKYKNKHHSSVIVLMSLIDLQLR